MRSEKLIFEGFPDHDIYNITAPFHWMGRDVIAGRVEKEPKNSLKLYYSKNLPTVGLQFPMRRFFLDCRILVLPG